jgi:acetyl esterase/lipase
MKIKFFLFGSMLMLSATFTFAQQKIIKLYEGKAPGSESWNWSEQVNDSSKNMFKTNLVYNVVEPTLTVFSPDPSVANGTAVVICPGGAFHVLSIKSEGTDVAQWLNKKGVTCFVLKYRLVHSLTDEPAKEMITQMGKPEFDDQNKKIIPLAIADGKEALTYVRKHAADYKISPDRIGIIGFSAGGTVAASAAFNYTADNRPDFVAPIYPFMPDSMTNNVPADAPPIFLVAASDDQLGLAPHSVNLYNKWIASKHSAELHLYAKGGHGFGMRKQNIPIDKWIERFGDWLDVGGFLQPKK